MNTATQLDARVSDVLKGKKPGATRIFRNDGASIIRSKNPQYVPFSKKPAIRKNVEKVLGLKIGKPSPDGHKIVGFKPLSWRRPFYAKDKEGRLHAFSALVVQELWSQKPKRAN